MSIEVIPTGAALGAEIRGINLAKPLDDAAFAAIVRAYNDHGVISRRIKRKMMPLKVSAFASRSRLRCIATVERLYLPLDSHGPLGGAERAMRPSG
jgi:hypothetical protein